MKNADLSQLRKTILVVNDDPEMITIMNLFFARQDYRILEASGGRIAIAIAISQSPDVILLDDMMPDLNGFEVCHILRSNPQTQSIPIIMFSSSIAEERAIASFAAGATEFLRAPFYQHEIIALVNKVLTRHDTSAE